ncbi:MAG: sigma-70 family RNA polymerase sigma factor [Acidobacteria bacterium]|nr:sigma-70 family RNA polymerase sigma factor [Acidobacteriota bacterium]
MSSLPPHEMSRLLAAWSDGDREALDRLYPLVEHELHRLARGYMRRERPDHTLQTTALVNEAYLKLIDQREVRWQNRAHFFGIAAQIMRRILIDHARKHAYAKRGGGAVHVPLDEAAVLTKARAAELVALDEALTALAALDERKGRVVELRYFGGLSVEEAAEVLGVSPDTVTRDWRRAKAFLRREMGGAAEKESRE